MNILHISANYPPLLGGPAASVPYLAAEQVKMGHNVFVLTVGLPRYSKNSFTVYKCGDVKGPRSSIWVGFKKGVKMGLLGRKVVKEHDIDIIHAHDPNISTIAHPIMNPKGKIPSLVKYSGDLAWELVGLKKGIHAERFWETITAKILIGAERVLFSSFDRVVAQSDYHRGMLKNICKVGENKLIQAPNGVFVFKYSKDEIEKAKKELPDGLKIASASRLVYWKGIEYGIKAMKYIDGNYIIFGDGPDKQRLQEIARNEGVSDKVVFFGKVPHERVQLYLRNCDVHLAPSIYEPFGISILDGFAAEIPVLGSNIGGIPELIDRPQLFEAKNVEDIVTKINYALENKKAIVSRQTKKIEDYLWPKIARDLQTEYERPINAK